MCVLFTKMYNKDEREIQNEGNGYWNANKGSWEGERGGWVWEVVERRKECDKKKTNRSGSLTVLSSNNLGMVLRYEHRVGLLLLLNGHDPCRDTQLSRS